jgi:hypothetical protein
MVFLTKRTFKLAKFLINSGYFLKTLPFRWKKTKIGIEIPASTRELCLWDFLKYFYLAHQIFLSIRLWQSLAAENKELTAYAVEILYYLRFLLLCVHQVSLIYNAHGWVNWMNQFFGFYASLEGNSRIHT